MGMCKQRFRLWHFIRNLGFNFVSTPRQNGSGGRVEIYIQNHLLWKRQSDLERDEIVGTAIKTMPEKVKSFYIFVMYGPPDSSKSLHPMQYFIICYLIYLSKSVFFWEIPTSTFQRDMTIMNLNQYYNSLVSSN